MTDDEAEAALNRADAETHEALQRITDRNNWTVAWVWCAVASLMTVVQMFEDWHRWTLNGKLMGSCLALFLVAFPAVLTMQRRRGKQIAVSGVIVMGYALLNMAVITFRPELLVK